MKKLVLLSIFTLNYNFFFAQEEVTLSTTSNTEVVWYNLAEGEKGRSSASQWDLAFDMKPQDAAIRINDAYGVKVYEFPGGIEEWENISEENTTGLESLINSDTAWNIGALNQLKDPDLPQPMFDYGWGTYDMNSHNVVGYRLFIIERNGVFKKKLWIKEMDSDNGGRYNFTYANIDGTEEVEVSLEKSDFTGKQFAYFSIATGEAVQHEAVAKEDWDLLFTKYMTEVTHPGYNVTMDYPVMSGVISNENVVVARVENVDNVAEFEDWASQDFSSNINTIGWDWSGYNWGLDEEGNTGGEHLFFVQEDLVFFAKAQDGSIWKMVFTGYELSSGNYDFTKELISTSSIAEENTQKGSLNVYPNPATTTVSILLDNMNEEHINIEIQSLTGQIVYANTVKSEGQFEVKNIDISNLNTGVYIVRVQTKGQELIQKLIIR